MNMTIVIVSGRSLESAMLVLAACSLVFLQAVMAGAIDGEPKTQGDEIPEQLRTVFDESKPLDGHLLSSVTRNLGDDIQKTMSSELEQLVSEMKNIQLRRNQQEAASQADVTIKVNETQLMDLLDANRNASEDIRARIALVGDNTGKLPQMSLSSTANSLLQAASERLATTSSYIGSKMQQLSTKMVDRIPPKLKTFFRWPNFLNFKIKFHKKYATLREDLYRNMVFLKNQIQVSMKNMRFIMGKRSFLLGQTQFADMTGAEYREKVGNKMPLAEEGLEKLSKGDRVVSKMQKLIASERNVYGAEIDSLVPKHGPKKTRSKRDVEEDDELNASEDDYDDMEIDGYPIGPGITTTQVDAMDVDNDFDSDDDFFMIVDEYAADAQFSAVDGVLEDVSHVIKPSERFEPVDLRQTGCIHNIENQGSCGSCYAYVTTTLGAYHICMAGQPDASGKRHVKRYHARFISDCGRHYTAEPPYLLNGCVGGRVSKAVDFARQAGLPAFIDYHWAQVSSSLYGTDICPYPRPGNLSDSSHWAIKLERVKFLEDSLLVSIEVDEVHMHLATVGPVLVNVQLWPDFEKYVGGVLDEPGEKSKSVHSMLIVGHEYDAQGREVFIVWNSHGLPWGESGFLRITAEALGHYALIFISALPSRFD